MNECYIIRQCISRHMVHIEAKQCIEENVRDSVITLVITADNNNNKRQTTTTTTRLITL